MEKGDSQDTAIMDQLRRQLGDRADMYSIPPPVFTAMQGELLEFNSGTGTLRARFPVRESYLNPYGTMQGGMVAAAVDNTLGPLSVLIAPPNVTRHLELTYSRPVTLDMEYIVVVATLLQRQGRWIHFRAEVRNGEGQRLARAKATHWIVDDPGTRGERTD